MSEKVSFLIPTYLRAVGITGTGGSIPPHPQVLTELEAKSSPFKVPRTVFPLDFQTSLMPTTYGVTKSHRTTMMTLFFILISNQATFTGIKVDTVLVASTLFWNRFKLILVCK